jgi:hypothetical protein
MNEALACGFADGVTPQTLRPVQPELCYRLKALKTWLITPLTYSRLAYSLATE